MNGATPAVTVSDKTGFALTAAYDPAKTASQAGDVMKVSSGTGANQISLSSGTVTVGTNNDKTGYTASTVSDKTGYALTAAYDPAKTAAQAGDAMALTSGERTTLTGVIWAALTSALTTVGSVGKLLVDNIDAAISTRSTYAGGDTSGTTTLLSRLTSTRAGLLDHLDADVSSRLATSSYTAPDNTDITAIKAKTDNLPATPAATGDAMTLTAGERTAVADALLSRDLGSGSNSVVTQERTVRSALRWLRNKWTISGSTLTVTCEDDSTTSHTATVTRASADAVSSIDPT